MERNRFENWKNGRRRIYQEPKFEIGNIVCHVVDEEATPYIVTALVYRLRDIVYMIRSADGEILVQEFEIKNHG